LLAKRDGNIGGDGGDRGRGGGRGDGDGERDGDGGGDGGVPYCLLIVHQSTGTHSAVATLPCSSLAWPHSFHDCLLVVYQTLGGGGGCDACENCNAGDGCNGCDGCVGCDG
jgi:hypothetical protein